MKNQRLGSFVTFLALLFVLWFYSNRNSKSGIPQHLVNNPEYEAGKDAKNVFGSALQICSTEPMTGYFRSGKCQTGEYDFCRHTLCAEMTADFLKYTKDLGNDLSTPKGKFPGLQEGDYWCLCVSRWMEAMKDGVPPPVLLHATHEEVLEYVPLEALSKEAVYLKEN